MQKIGKIDELEALVLPKIQKLAAQIRTALAHDVTEPGAGLNALKLLRKIGHEETNQILHETMLLKGAQWLIANHYKTADLDWRWNPRLGGGATEPDLQASRGSKILASAEATTSTDPKGEINRRMGETPEWHAGARNTIL